MPLLILVMLGAVVLWLMSSIFFERIGKTFRKLFKKFINK
jgi:hypothetical protein